ncbi:MAG: glutamine amidotransferase [Acidimicrobiales bacterium]
MSRGGPMDVSKVRIVVVHPDLLGTYGDGGNAVVLAQRLRWRGIEAEVLQAASDLPLPASADLYCLGGGEDGPQSASVAALRSDGSLVATVAAGAAVIAVCAGFQVVGESFPGADGRRREGLGLLDVRAERGHGPRAVGELVAADASGLGLGLLTGYENHGSVTRLGSGVSALATVRRGVGNGAGDGTEGALCGHVVGTYLHGPVLARNPVLADLLLSWVVGPLGALDDTDVLRLRAERLRRAQAGRGLLRRLSGGARLARPARPGRPWPTSGARGLRRGP